MARDTVEIKSAMLSYLKATPSVTSLLIGISGTAIKENQWQGTIFDFPAVRLSVDLFPSINGCGPDKADIILETFSAEKSSLQADTISAAEYRLLHKHAFNSLGLQFSSVVVTKIVRAEASIYGWKSGLYLTVLVN